MDEEITIQVVQIPYREGRTWRTDEIVRQIKSATGLETRQTDPEALFRGSGRGLTHRQLQATVESAMPPDWRDHFYEPQEPEHAAWPDSN